MTDPAPLLTMDEKRERQLRKGRHRDDAVKFSAVLELWAEIDALRLARAQDAEKIARLKAGVIRVFERLCDVLDDKYVSGIVAENTRLRAQVETLTRDLDTGGTK